jgi:hypothetical protein
MAKMAEIVGRFALLEGCWEDGLADKNRIFSFSRRIGRNGARCLSRANRRTMFSVSAAQDTAVGGEMRPEKFGQSGEEKMS